MALPPVRGEQRPGASERGEALCLSGLKTAKGTAVLLDGGFVRRRFVYPAKRRPVVADVQPLARSLRSARRGAYRVVYAIDEGNSLVLVVRIEHRADVYRPLLQSGVRRPPVASD